MNKIQRKFTRKKNIEENCTTKNYKIKFKIKEELHEQSSDEFHQEKNTTQSFTIENRKMKVKRKVKFYEQSSNELCKQKEHNDVSESRKKELTSQWFHL